MQPTLEGYKEAIYSGQRKRKEKRRKGKEREWLYICKNNTMKKIKLVFHQFH